MINWYSCSDDKKKLDKSLLPLGSDDNVIIYGDCNILSPVLKCKTYSGNYVYIEQFHRFYFIDNVVWSKGFYFIYCKIDVLYTYQNSINNMNCLISRSETLKNSDLPDSNISVKLNYRTITDDFGKTVTNNTTTYILGVI